MVFGNSNIVKGGEDEAYFISLYNRYKDMMFSIANNILVDKGLSEDAVSNAFISVIEHFESVRSMDENEVKGYIIVVVKNAAKRIAKTFKPESDFGIRILRCGIVKILVNPTGLTAFCASPHHKIL